MLFSTPFLMDAEELDESLQLELIEMQCDESLKNQLLSLTYFKRSLEKAKFPRMRIHTKIIMSLFSSTYICEQTFSLWAMNKSRLNPKWPTAIRVMSWPLNDQTYSWSISYPSVQSTAPIECKAGSIKGEFQIDDSIHVLITQLHNEKMRKRLLRNNELPNFFVTLIKTHEPKAVI